MPTVAQQLMADLGHPYIRGEHLATARRLAEEYASVVKRIEAGEEVWVNENGDYETAEQHATREAQLRAFFERNA